MPTLALPDGLTLGYDDTGGSRPVVVFSHGLLMDRTMFAAQVEALRGSYRVLSWDERGHGQSHGGGSFSYWDSARDLLALLDHLGIDAAVLAGMSQGGFLSLRAALLAPDRVRGLVLIDSQAGVEQEEAVPLYGAMVADWQQHGLSEDAAATIAGLLLGPDVDPAPWIATWQARDRDQLLPSFQALVTREDLTDRLGEIAAPALVLHGTQDASIAMERAEALCAGLADCRALVRLEGAGHASNLARPTAVNSAIVDFLAGLAGPATGR